ncbi:hypothetical protein M5K25_002797 [Dendrobium thyrsiflorum]|uniref:Uncharacterized protein n=1 Tax=Dendrobium thyrsiflorum TaxID=117978 RepID=A0ABD0VPF7_DENTH
MADPDVDHGLYDDQSLVDILQLLFFDPNPEIDDTTNDYIDRIIFTLAPSIEEHLPSGQWKITGRSHAPFPPANFSWIHTLGVLSLLVASSGLLRFFFRQTPNGALLGWLECSVRNFVSSEIYSDVVIVILGIFFNCPDPIFSSILNCSGVKVNNLLLNGTSPQELLAC